MNRLTVVIEVNDDEAFEKDNDRIFSSLKSNADEYPPANRVTSISIYDECHRLFLIRKAMEEDDIELAHKCIIHILNYSDISSLSTFSDVLLDVGP
jgi:hypothetical protein